MVTASLVTLSFTTTTDLVDKNYAALAELPPEVKSEKHHPFTDAELQVLWDNTNDAAVKFALIYCYTRLRPTELLKIRTESVFLSDRYMLGGMKTDAGKNRVIPIAEKIYPFITEMYNSCNEYLCIDYKDEKPILNYDRLRMHYWDRSNIQIIKEHLPHDGRHTCATLLNNANVPEMVTQKILGHAGKISRKKSTPTRQSSSLSKP